MSSYTSLAFRSASGRNGDENHVALTFYSLLSLFRAHRLLNLRPTSLKKERPLLHFSFRDYRILSTLLLLVIVTAAFLAWRFYPGSWGFEGSDSFSRIATNFVAHGSFSSALRPPIYSLFLAVNMALFPAHWGLSSALIQAGVGILIGLSLVVTTRVIGGNGWAASIALFLYATHFLFQIEVTAKRDTAVFTLLLVCFVLIVPLFSRSLQSKHLLLASVAAAAFLTRASGIVLIPILLFTILWDTRQKLLVERTTSFVRPALLFLVLVLPWQLTMAGITGEVELSSAAASGQNLWKGNNPYFFSLWPGVDLDALDPYLDKSLKPSLMSPEADKELENRAKSFISQHPTLFVKASVVKFFAFFNPVPTPYGSAQFELQNGRMVLSDYDPRNRLLMGISTIHFLVIFSAWIVFLFRRREYPSFSVSVANHSLVVAAAFAAIHAICFPELRYRLPVDIIFIPFAASVLANEARSLLIRTSRAKVYDAVPIGNPST